MYRKFNSEFTFRAEPPPSKLSRDIDELLLRRGVDLDADLERVPFLSVLPRESSSGIKEGSATRASATLMGELEEVVQRSVGTQTMGEETVVEVNEEETQVPAEKAKVAVDGPVQRYWQRVARLNRENNEAHRPEALPKTSQRKIKAKARTISSPRSKDTCEPKPPSVSPLPWPPRTPPTAKPPPTYLPMIWGKITTPIPLQSTLLMQTSYTFKTAIITCAPLRRRILSLCPWRIPTLPQFLALVGLVGTLGVRLSVSLDGQPTGLVVDDVGAAARWGGAVSGMESGEVAVVRVFVCMGLCDDEGGHRMAVAKWGR